MQWTVLIPAKSLPQAKSRLVDSTPDPASHAELVHAIRADTVAAARAAAGVARIVMVVDKPDAQAVSGPADTDPGAVVSSFTQTAPGLNAALDEAAAYAAQRWPESGIAALVGDLPALRSAELSAALAEAQHFARTFVADSDGTGTTLLAVRPGQPLHPRFGAGSAERHGTDAQPVAGGDGLRQDVDTDADLMKALVLGVGPATAAVTSHRQLCVHLDRG